MNNQSNNNDDSDQKKRESNNNDNTLLIVSTSVLGTIVALGLGYFLFQKIQEGNREFEKAEQAIRDFKYKLR